MKRIISLIMVALLCLPFSPAIADDGDTVAKLILDIKDKFNISDDEFVFENYSKDDYSDNIIYYLSWKSKANDEYSHQPYISVRVEEDGDVEYYRKSQTYYSDIALAKFSETEVLAKAKEYINIIAPERADNLADGKLSEDTQYTVQFERTVNGIPVADNYISVELHPDDLSIIRYNAAWTEAEFSSPDNAIDYTLAKDAYIDSIGYELLYNIKTEKGEIKDIYLSYESKDSSAVIDAFSGEAVKIDGFVFRTAGGGAMNDAVAAESAKSSLSAEEQAMVDEINKMITKEDAEAIARGIPEFAIREDAEVSSYSVSRNQYGDYVASIYFSISKKDEYYSARVSVNAQTKEVMSFSKYQDIKDTEKACDAEQAKKTADAFLNKYYADKMAEVQPDFVIGESDKYRFYYDRYAGNIRVKNNGINISVNEYTGEIDNFSCTWADTEFPAYDIVVAPNAIYKNVITDDNFRLQYVITTEYIYHEETGKETTSSDVNLVYAVLDSPIYSAETGKEINSRGEAVTEKFAGYNDISGHYCETAATELAKIGIYFEGGVLNPDSAVTQAEFLKLMYRVMYGYYPDNSDVYRQLISDGVLTEDEISENITRMDGIRYFINIMGYKEVAQLDSIYVCPFADVADNMKGYAALAGGLKIVNNSVSTFRPDALMTRGECLTIIYNYLNKL